MKSFVSVLAAACLVTVRAHTMLVCSATSCNTPGRVTVFLGTYAHGGDFGANAAPSPGDIQITTMGGTTYKFEFSKQCQSPPTSGSASFAAVEASLKAASGQGGLTNVCRDQRVTNKPIIDDESIITCYNHDIKGLSSTASEGRSVTVGSKKIYTVSEWESTGNVFCGFPNSNLAGYYYMVMDNVQPGDYRMKGWTTDYTLASGSDHDATMAQYGLGVCGIIGFDNDATTALAKSKEYAFSLSVATTTCAASNKCGTVGTSISGLISASVSDCGNKDPGYMCDARCDQGYTQVGSMMCLANGEWGGFQCVPESAASTTKPCDLNDVSQAITGAVGVEFNGAAMCGYTSAHGAKCTAACAAPRVLVETSPNSLECVNGNWVANGAECKEVVDVVLAPPPSITVAEADDVSLKITFGTATKCSTGKYCSAATKYRFRLTITDVATGQVETSDCPDFNSGVAPTDGLMCYLPTGETLGNKKYGITAYVENRAGWSGPSQAQEFWPQWPRQELTAAQLCYVDTSVSNDVNAVGPHMRDGVDVVGKDWIKYYSAAVDINYQPTRVEATSAASCCMTCANTEGCDYWTYVKNSTACYIKHQDDRTIYIDTVDPSRISSLASPHAYNFDNHKNNLWNDTVDGADSAWGGYSEEVHGINFKPDWRGKRRLSTASYTKFDDMICKFHAVTVLMTGDLKAQCQAMCDSSTQAGGCPGFSVSETHRYCYICYNVQPEGGIDHKVNYGPETGQLHWNPHCDGGHWCTTQNHGNSQLYWKDTAVPNGDSLNPETTANTDYMMGIDFMGADWVKFSNRRGETDDPESCEQACEDDPHCCYWTWSPIDPDEACYLKSTVPMNSHDFGYGQLVHNFAAVSGYSKDANQVGRCENQTQVTILKASTPTIYPVGIFRRHFDRFAETQGHKFFPTRPSLYMLGSGISLGYIRQLTIGQNSTACNNNMDLKNPCFTQEEIDALEQQFADEKELYDAATTTEKDAYTYFGGLPSPHTKWQQSTKSTTTGDFCAVTGDWNCNVPSSGNAQATCLAWCASGDYSFCSVDSGNTNGFQCCQGSNTCATTQVPTDSRFYTIFVR